MTDTTPFDADIVETVARERGVAVADLRAALGRHQSTVGENPGADSLVYEWRRYHPGDPLVARTEDWYVCAVRPAIWAEFETALDTDLAAVRAVHDRQARRLVDDEHPFEEQPAMLLARS